LTTSGIPNHKLKVKIKTPIMLLRNLVKVKGFGKRSKLTVTIISNNVTGRLLRKQKRKSYYLME